jgi:hypothetical protein
MSLFDKEEVIAPTIEAAVAEAIKPVVVAAPVVSGAKCTRDTRGETPCAVTDCENCN